MKQAAVPVLIVDDSAIVRERLCGLLSEQPGVRVAGQASSAAEAWEVFQQCRPAVTVLDIQLPDGTGLDVLCRIKKADSACKVLVLTNHADPIYRSECQRLGADAFLHKSTEFESIVALIAMDRGKADCSIAGEAEASLDRGAPCANSSAAQTPPALPHVPPSPQTLRPATP